MNKTNHDFYLDIGNATLKQKLEKHEPNAHVNQTNSK